jgi:hypothetical protein
MATQNRKPRGRPPMSQSNNDKAAVQHTDNSVSGNYSMPDAELEAEILQQIIEMEERERQISLDEKYASEISNIPDTLLNGDQDMAEILAQIEQMENGTNPHAHPIPLTQPVQHPIPIPSQLFQGTQQSITDIDEKRRKIEADRLIRAEQHSAYLASLAIDQERERISKEKIENEIAQNLDDHEIRQIMRDYNDNIEPDESSTLHDEQVVEEQVPKTIEELRLARLKRFATQ